jgi:hypothetical protein
MVQPVISFKEDDIITFNFPIYTIKGFIEMEKEKIEIYYNISNYKIEKKLDISGGVSKANEEYDFSHICEMEVIKYKWHDIKTFPNNETVWEKIRKIFEPVFNIIEIKYDDVGHLIFKINLIAKKPGIIRNKDELGLEIKVYDNDCSIMNGVNKNNLIYEHNSVLEMRVSDLLTFYISHDK